jgi:hypothetical protein
MISLSNRALAHNIHFANCIFMHEHFVQYAVMVSYHDNLRRLIRFKKHALTSSVIFIILREVLALTHMKRRLPSVGRKRGFRGG